VDYQWVDCEVKQRVLLRPGRLVLGAGARRDSIITHSARIGRPRSSRDAG
jgi:hypothetical protein